MENYKLLLLLDENENNIFLDGIDMKRQSIINPRTAPNFYEFIEKKLAVDECCGCKSIATTEYNGKYLKRKKELYVTEEQFEQIKRKIFEVAVTVCFCEIKNEEAIDFKFYWEAVEYINYVRKNKQTVCIDQNTANITKILPLPTTIDDEIIDEKYNKTFQKTK